MTRPGQVEYWTWRPGYDNPCSTHRTLLAACRAADKCEANGGMKHSILKVEMIFATPAPKRRTRRG